MTDHAPDRQPTAHRHRSGAGPDAQPRPYRVNFVCTGNICRSPMAATVARAAFADAGLGERVSVSSSGTIAYHVGDPADRRALAVLRSRGYDGSDHRADQLRATDLAATDLVVALDRDHLDEILALVGDDRPARVRLLRSFDPSSPDGAEVDDPYYGGRAGFETALDHIQAAMPGLLDTVRLDLERRAADARGPSAGPA